MDTSKSRFQFVKLAALFGLALGMLGLGGLLARVYFGDALYADGANPNQALPLLFIELFPTWLAALIGVGRSIGCYEYCRRPSCVLLANHSPTIFIAAH